MKLNRRNFHEGKESLARSKNEKQQPVIFAFFFFYMEEKPHNGRFVGNRARLVLPRATPKRTNGWTEPATTEGKCRAIDKTRRGYKRWSEAPTVLRLERPTERASASECEWARGGFSKQRQRAARGRGRERRSEVNEGNWGVWKKETR